MQSESHRRRWLAAGITAVVLLTVVALRFWFGRSPNGEDQANAAAKKKKARAHTWPLFGGSLNRNMVNTFEKDVPSEWSVEEGQEKNIKWAAKLGSRSYAGPVIANGRIF